MPAHPLNSLDPQQNIHDTRRIGLLWLVQLRWWAVAGQILTLTVGVLLFHLDIPISAVSAVLVVEIVTNSGLALRLRTRKGPPAPHLLPLTLYGDIALLTGLLYVTGGTMNPFTFLFLVHITLGAILLPARLAWGLTATTIIFYGVMFLPSFLQGGRGEAEQQIQQVCNVTNLNMDLHLQGMWFAYTISAILITFFASRIQHSLSEYHRTIARLHQEKHQNDKLRALATLAAGAAHELSTPLATIALASGEMVYSCENKIYDTGLLEDAQLIRDQTRRCKNILFQMSADAGAVQAEKYIPTTVEQLLTNALDLLGEIPQKLVINNRVPGQSLRVPAHAVSWALKGLLSNAADASAPDQEILLECQEEGEYICFRVRDHGCGMAQEVVSQAADPFFTTKAVGRGMGLGLFLAKSLASQLGGSLRIQSMESKGTTITMTFKKSLIRQPITHGEI
ncbi:MAG: ATP-binding protein [Desulfurivibrionaceae bacterium]|nr:ATP-binding protein [Desulfurivibrionaceae bacterium]